MVSLHLQSGDLENIRFAYSPLIELAFAYCDLRSGKIPSQHRRWAEATERAIHGLHFPFMDAVVLANMYIADFVTQTPTQARLTLDDEIAQMYATSERIIRDDVRYLYEHGRAQGEMSVEVDEVLRYFLAYPHDALHCLEDELRLFWERAMAPYWDRIQVILENDILYQARQMALYGVEHMISALSPEKLEYHDGEIIIHKPHCGDQDFELDGEGVIFVPKALREDGVSWQVACPWLPMVIYGARGGATLYHTPAQPDPESALTMMIGEGRAKVLESLKTPLHTAELAHRLQVTSGAVSQHLGKLSQAGLVTSHRSSSKVYYRLTPRGEKLLAVFTE